ELHLRDGLADAVAPREPERRDARVDQGRVRSGAADVLQADGPLREHRQPRLGRGTRRAAARLRRPAASDRCALRLLRRRTEPMLPAGEPAADVPLLRGARARQALAPRASGLRASRRLHRQGCRPGRVPADARRARAVIPRRIKRQSGRHALVDGIPFVLPVNSDRTSALMAACEIDAAKAAALLPGNELHPARLWHRAVLLITVINYELTDIGKYIEFSIGIACTRGARPAPPLLPFPLRRAFGFGQYVLDLPVSTEISVKGGKGVWGWPRHQASLDFVVADDT